MQHNEDYVLKVLQDVGLVTRKQIDGARKRLNGANNVVDLLVKDGVVSEADISRTLAAQAHMCCRNAHERSRTSTGFPIRS